MLLVAEIPAKIISCRSNPGKVPISCETESRGVTAQRKPPPLVLSVNISEARKADARRKLTINSRIDIVRFAISQDWLKDRQNFPPSFNDLFFSYRR